MSWSDQLLIGKIWSKINNSEKVKRHFRMTNDFCCIYLDIYQHYFIHHYNYLFYSYFLSTLLIITITAYLSTLQWIKHLPFEPFTTTFQMLYTRPCSTACLPSYYVSSDWSTQFLPQHHETNTLENACVDLYWLWKQMMREWVKLILSLSLFHSASLFGPSNHISFRSRGERRQTFYLRHGY